MTGSICFDIFTKALSGFKCETSLYRAELLGYVLNLFLNYIYFEEYHSEQLLYRSHVCKLCTDCVRSKADPPENCHLNVKKLPKNLFIYLLWFVVCR